MTEWFKASATVLAAAYAAGEVSPVDVLRDCLDRLDAVNPVLNAVIAEDRETAESNAHASAERWEDG